MSDVEFRVRARVIARDIIEMFNLLRRLVIIYKDYEMMCEKYREECDYLLSTLPEDLPYIISDVEELHRKYTTKDLDVMIEVVKKWVRVEGGGE